MQEIVSKENTKIKFLRKLGVKKYRNKFDSFLVENIAIIYDAMRSGYKPESLFVVQEILESNSEKLKFIMKNIRVENIFIINEQINKSFSNLETPAGIAVVYNKNEKQKLNFAKRLLYLNGIKDPGNLGTILRSAVAFGVTQIVLDENCVDLYNPKLIQSAKDAIFKVNVIFDKNREILQKIKSKMKIFVTDVNGGVEVHSAFKNINIFCVVLGSESHGVDVTIRNMADKEINIKSSSEMESLNVAVSTGIILYEMYNTI